MRRARRTERKAFGALFLMILGLAVVVTLGVPRARAAQELGDAAEEEEFARGPRELHRSGVYLGLGGVYALENFDLGDNGTAGLDPSDAWGVDARVGYRFHPNLAAEVDAQYLGELKIRDKVEFTRWRVDVVAATANGKFFFLTRHLQPYVVAGAGLLYMNFEEGTMRVPRDRDRSEFVARGGLGVDFYLLEDVVVNGEATYLWPTGSLDDYQMATFVLGVQYRF